MILEKLVLRNFRQFRGIQQIEFASEPGDNGKNVTVIFGNTGRGKTGIFRAIVFCLYGDHLLSQDEEVTENELHLVNLDALQESASTANHVETTVELEFRHKGEHYSIKRTLLGMMDGNERIEQPPTVVLAHTNADGNTRTICDQDEIRRIINGILDKNVREYFLFDGEKMQRLTLANIQQRREIARGIRNLLNIDTLEKAIAASHLLKTRLNTELSNKSTGEYGRVLYQHNELDEKRGALQSRLEELEAEYSRADIQKKQARKQLAQYEEIVHILHERSVAEDQLEYEEAQARNLLSEMKTRTGRASLLLLADTVGSVFSFLDNEQTEGKRPPKMRKDFIERLLSEKECICGRPLLLGTESHNRVVVLKDATCDVELDRSATDMWRHLSSISSQRDEIFGTMETLLQRYGNHKNNIEKFRLTIEALDKEIGGTERKDAAQLEEHRKNIESKQIEIEAKRMQTNDDLQRLEVEIEQCVHRRTALEKDEKLKDELSQRASLAEEAHGILKAVHHEFTSEIKDEVAKEANEYFAQLLDEEGRQTLKNIVVNDDYSLQILDKWNKPFLADISAGQRQIMSISFIAALAKAASADSVLEMPFFMDTPFARLSFAHRKNLINIIPSFCAQWILLATDTEFSKEEASVLRDTGRWGRFFLLRGERTGGSVIEERAVFDVPSTLRGRLEESQ